MILLLFAQAFATNNTKTLQHIIWQAELLRWSEKAQTTAAKMLHVLQSKLHELNNEGESKRQCKYVFVRVDPT